MAAMVSASVSPTHRAHGALLRKIPAGHRDRIVCVQAFVMRGDDAVTGDAFLGIQLA